MMPVEPNPTHISKMCNTSPTGQCPSIHLIIFATYIDLAYTFVQNKTYAVMIDAIVAAYFSCVFVFIRNPPLFNYIYFATKSSKKNSSCNTTMPKTLRFTSLVIKSIVTFVGKSINKKQKRPFLRALLLVNYCMRRLPYPRIPQSTVLQREFHRSRRNGLLRTLCHIRR